MVDAYMTVRAPDAKQVAEFSEESPIRDEYINEEIGGDELTVTIHSSALDDVDEVYDTVIEHTNIKASKVTKD